MSAQIMDSLENQKNTYDIIHVEGGQLYDIKQSGVKVTLHPMCWRGYFGEYMLREKQLYLHNLFVHSDEKCPSVNNVTVSNRLGILSDFKHYGRVDIRMDFTGSLIIAKDYLKDYYDCMGCQNAILYETVEELILNNGVVTDKVDYSSKIKEIREEYGNSRYSEEQKNEIEKKVKKLFYQKQ